MSREFGIGLVGADCNPSLVSDAFKAQACIRMVFAQTHGRDIADSAAALALKPSQIDVIQKLQVGEAIVRISGRINRPFLVRITP